MTGEQLQLAILSQLDEAGEISDTRELQLPSTGSAAGSEHSVQMAIKAALDSLAGREMVTSSQKQVDSLALTPEGEEMAQDGSYEYRVWTVLGDSEEPQDLKQLSARLGDNVAKVGQLNAFKEKWLRKEGTGFVRNVRLNKVMDQDLSMYLIRATVPRLHKRPTMFGYNCWRSSSLAHMQTRRL